METKPSTGKIAAYLTGLATLGIVSFVVLAMVVQYRHTRPIQPLPSQFATQTPRAQPIAALQLGLLTSLEASHANLKNGRRARAMHALNAAKRVAEIGKDAAGSQRPAFEQAVEAIKETRETLQNGKPERAPQTLQKAIEALNSNPKPTPPSSVSLPADLPAYDGATVVNALGLRIGEVESAHGDQVQVNLGMQDLLGFIDLGGTPVTVPTRRLLFGKKKDVGPTMVCLPTFQQKPEQIAGEMKAQGTAQ